MSATDGPRVRRPSIVGSDWSAAEIVACMPAGSEILPVRTLPVLGSARPMPVKKPLQRRVSAWLPTSWLKHAAFLTPASLNRFPAPRPAWNSVCPTWARMPRLLEHVRARVHRHDGDAGGDGLLDRGLSASAFGIETTRPDGFLATAASMRADMAGMSLSAPGAL